MKFKNNALLISIITTLLLLISISFVSAPWSWDGNTYTDDENGVGGEIIKFAEDILVITKNADIKDEANKKTITIKQGGSIEIKGIKYPINTAENNQFVFNQNGELIEETKFTTSEDYEYKIKAYNILLPSKTQVTYEQDRVVFNLPPGSQVSRPEIAEDSGETADPKQLFVYQSNDVIKLENGRWFETKAGSEGKTTLYYQDYGFYFTDKNIIIKSSRGDELLIYNPNFNNEEESKREIYLYSSENDINPEKNFVLLNINKVILSSSNENGPAVFFAPGNRMGIASNSEHTVSAQAKKGKVIVTPAKDTKIPSIKINGNSLVNLDKRSFFAQNNELWFHPDTELIGDFKHGKYDAPIELTLIDKDEKDVKNFNVYSNSRDQYASVINGNFQGPLKSFKTKLGFFVSATVVFNQLTPSAQDFYSGLSEERQMELLEYAGYSQDTSMGVKGISETSKKTQTAKLQSALNNLIIEEKRRRQNPSAVSVRILGGGGSGTIIGIDKEGYPIVLTAGHLGGASRPGYKYSKSRLGGITLPDGRSFDGVVIAGIGRYNSGQDISIIRLTEKVEGIPYVPIASESHVINKGDLVLKIGYPAYKNRQFTQTQTNIVQVGDIGKTLTRSRSYGGESGGGLFHNGRVIGIVSTKEGGYTGIGFIRSFLRQNGYDYLISIILSVIKLHPL